MISSGNVLTYPFSFSASAGRGETLTDSLPPCVNVSLAGVMFKILANGKVSISRCFFFWLKLYGTPLNINLMCKKLDHIEK